MKIKYLKKNSVSVVNEDNWKSYENSEKGRQELQTEVSEPYLSEILAVWGDAPTVTEKVFEEQPQQPTLEERVLAMEEVILNLL